MRTGFADVPGLTFFSLIIIAVVAGVATPFSLLAADHLVIEVMAGNSSQLRQAIRDANENTGPPPEIRLQQGEYLILGSELPEPRRPMIISGEGSSSATRLVGDGSSRLLSFTRQATPLGRNSLTLQNLTISSFGEDGPGGAIRYSTNGTLSLIDVVFRSNRTDSEGGAVFLGGGGLVISESVFESNRAERGGAIYIAGSILRMSDSRVEDNHSSLQGGAVFSDSTNLIFERVNFRGNSAIESGGAVRATNATLGIQESNFYLNRAGDGCALSASNYGRSYVFFSAFSGDCDGALMNLGSEFSSIGLRNNAVLASNIGIRIAHSGPEVNTPEFYGNLLASSNGAVCTNQGSLPFRSAGFNIVADDSCELTDDSDMQDVDTGLRFDTDSEELVTSIDSPAVDLFENPRWWIPVSDSRGLGRPQDANGDGVFEFDAGTYEVQGGDDLLPSQSGVFYDPAHDQEGVFLEVLPDGRAVVGWFSYFPRGAVPPLPPALAWLIGTGSVVGNSVVVDSLLEVCCTRFGDQFSSAELYKQRVGGVALVFSDCDSTNQPGQLYFQNEFEVEDVPSYRDQLYPLHRLVSVVPCNGAGAAHRRSGRSGAFYDPKRDGEGIFVQWSSESEAVLVWYTYTPDGTRQFWTISGETSVDGKVLRAQMLYPSNPRFFGETSDTAMVEWGTLTIEYLDCDHIELGWESLIDGFSSGSLSYARLTQLADTDCDLQTSP